MEVNIALTAEENAYALINRSNPTVPIPVSALNVQLGEPVSSLSAMKSTQHLSPMLSTTIWVESLLRFVTFGSGIKTSRNGKVWDNEIAPPGNNVTGIYTSEYDNNIYVVMDGNALYRTTDFMFYSDIPLTGIDNALGKLIVTQTHELVVTVGVSVFVLPVGASAWEIVGVAESGEGWHRLCYLKGAEGGDFVATYRTDDIAIYNITTRTKTFVYQPADKVYDISWNPDAQQLLGTCLHPDRSTIYIGSNLSTAPSFVENSSGIMGYYFVAYLPGVMKWVLYNRFGGYFSGSPWAWSGVDKIWTKTDYITYSPSLNKVIQVNDSGVAYSDNLDNWTLVYHQYMLDDIQDGEVFYHEEEDKVIYSGIRGVVAKVDRMGNWEYIYARGLRNCRSMCYSPTLDLYVAVGVYDEPGETGSFISTSSDLVNWNEVYYSEMWMMYVVWVGSLQLFISCGTTLKTSPDGTTWTTHFTHEGTSRLSRIAYSPELDLVLVSSINSSITLRAANGVDWVEGTFPLASAQYMEWIPFLSQFIVTRGPDLALSSDGVDWTTHAAPASRLNPQVINDLGIIFSTCVGQPVTWWSRNGYEWSPLPMDTPAALQTTRFCATCWFPTAQRVQTLSKVPVYAFDPVLAGDTSLTVTAIPDKGYKDDVTLSYYRPTIRDIAGPSEDLPVVVFDAELYDPENPSVYLSDSKMKICETLGVLEDEIIIVGGIPMPFGDSVKQTDVMAVFGSYVYSGGSYSVKIDIEPDIPYLGEIKMFSYAQVPTNWMVCDGTILPVQQYQSLYSLLGNQFGGDGVTTFALPDLRDRTPMCMGIRSDDSQVIQCGQIDGVDEIPLTIDQMPAHHHRLFGTTENATGKMTPGNHLATVKLAGATGAYVPTYAESDVLKNVTLNTNSIEVVGSAIPHNNIQPSLGLNFCIAVIGKSPVSG